MIKYTACALYLILATATAAMAAPVRYLVDTERSVLRIQLGTAGLFGFLGDDHQIEARISQGEIARSSESQADNSVRLSIPAASLKVLDPKLSDKDRAEVQSKMDGDQVLDVAHHPTIEFQSTQVESKGKDELVVTGKLTLRDVAKPVKVRCRLESQAGLLKVSGEADFKQKDFGIQPVGAGLGTVKVKNEIHLTFEVYARPAAD